MNKNLNFLLVYLCVTVFTQFCNVTAKGMDNPGEGGGIGNEIGPNSNTVLSGGGLINPLTGMPSYDVKVLRMLSNTGYNLDIDFHYGSNIRQEATQDNSAAPTGWCGVGWHMGFSYIYSADADTATLGDDKYYYVYANGVVSEIEMMPDSAYRIKNDPFWKVEPVRWTLLNINFLGGWRVTKTDGSKFFFGVESLNDTASRAADLSFWPRYDSTGTLIKVPTGGGAYWNAYPNYKRWKLNYGEDLNGSRISFKYTQIQDTIHTPHDGDLIYIRESHVKETWVNDNGDRFVFTTGSKNQNERPATLSTYFPNYYETKYLRSIQYHDKSNALLDSVSLIYTGDAGQLSHLYSGTTGFEKRFLLGIISHKSVGVVNRVFEYDRNPSTIGLLTRISEPVIGKSTVFSYDMQSITEIDSGVQHEYRFPVVAKILVYDGVKTTPAQTITYTYPTNPADQKYIPTTGLGFWGVVRANSGRGDVVTRYEINPANHLFGTPLNISTYSTGGQLVAQQKNYTQSRLFITAEADTFYYTVVNKNESMVNGITTANGLPFCALDTNTGIASMVYKTNSDHATLLTKTDFAYQHYSGMGTGTDSKRQLTQTAATTVYEVPRFIANCDLLIDSVDSPRVYMPIKVVSASFTTWAPSIGTPGYYRPAKTYAWKSGAAVPSKNFSAFNLNKPDTNGWVYTGSVDRYNKCGSVLQSSGPNGTHGSTIYRADYNLPLAKISNSRYDECAVFTCDYDIGDPAHPTYFDFANGWEKAGSILSSDTTHFGEKAVYINNAFGPSRNIRIYQGQDYVMSAWVYVASGTLEMYGDYRHLLTDTIPHSVSAAIKNFSVPAATANATGKWRRIELRIPALTDLTPNDWTSQNWCVRVYVGSPNGAKAFIDDIRFYPKDALVTTTYYDMKWRVPKIEVNANHEPSKLAELDSLGRIKAVYKINKEKCSQETGYKTITMGKEYHMMGDDIRVLSPYGGEQLRAGSQYAITWWPGKNAIGAGGIDLKFYDGTSWSPLASGITGRNAHVWNIPAGVKTGCRIKIVSVSDTTKWDQSDTTFSIFVNSAPSAPVLTSPINNADITTNSIQLTWGASSDPDGNPITYKVEIRRDKTAWTSEIDNYGSTQLSVSLPQIGPYDWRITASDGSLSATSVEGKFYYVPADFFIIRDISNRMVQVIENALYESIYNTLSLEKKPKFANTYRNTADEPGYKVFADRAYFYSERSPYDAEYACNNFSYNVWHTHKSGNNKWLGWKYEGAGNGYTGLGGGGGCGLTDGEMENILLSANISSPPAISFTYEWACPGSGSKTYSWDQEVWPGGNDRYHAIMRIKWTTVTGYHTWYKGWHRGVGGSAGWKTDGEWSGPGGHKLDKVWLRMFKYDPN